MAKIVAWSGLFVMLIATMMVASHAADCSGDINVLRQRCLQYVTGGGPMVPPDGGCCAAVQQADVPCVCSYITPPVEKIISVDKLIYVAKMCNRALKPGSKCGSVVVHG